MSHDHISFIGVVQSGHGTSTPTVSSAGSSASAPHPAHPHQAVSLDAYMCSRVITRL